MSSTAASRAKRSDALPDRQDRPERATSSAPTSSRLPHSLKALTPEIEAELVSVAASAGCELIHAEWKGGVLRLFLDRAAVAAPAVAAENGVEIAGETGAVGVSLGDCEQVAKLSSALLDVLDFGGGRYVLEVSSPGLDRQLYRPSDYPRFIGRLARVTYESADPAARPARRTVIARLTEFHAPGGPLTTSGTGAVTLLDERTGERLTLSLENIRLARLEVEL